MFSDISEIEQRVLVGTAEREIQAAIKASGVTSLSKIKNKSNKTSTRDSSNNSRILKRDDLPLKPKCSSTNLIPKSSSNATPKSNKEDSNALQAQAKENSNNNNNISPDHVSAPNSEVIKEYKYLIEKLKTFEFRPDIYCLPVIKINHPCHCFIDYSAVRVNPSLYNGENIWMLKVAGQNRGFGIEIFSSLEKLKEIIKDVARGYQETIVQGNESKTRSKVVIKSAKFVIQKYIEQPLLFREKKFDLRVWVMLTHEMKPFIFQECYVRLSTESYNTKNLQDKLVHLTNNALQKYSNTYSAEDTLRTTAELERVVQESHPEYRFTETWGQICEIAKLVLQAGGSQLNANNKNKSFEIFGMDFMMDSKLKVWLIEINSNPSISTSGSLLSSLIPRMLDDAFKLTIDQLFPEPKSLRVGDLLTSHLRSSKRRLPVYPVTNYVDDDNLWRSLGVEIL